MTEYTRPATWEDVRTLASHLNEAGVAYALVGGYALGAHGYNRFTEDVDILVDPSTENSRRSAAESPATATSSIVVIKSGSTEYIINWC